MFKLLYNRYPLSLDDLTSASAPLYGMVSHSMSLALVRMAGRAGKAAIVTRGVMRTVAGLALTQRNAPRDVKLETFGRLS